MRAWTGLALCLVPLAALAAVSFDIASVAGVYKYTIANSRADSGRSENILEIVKRSPTEAYFRTHLEFPNGHICAVHAIASVEGNELVWRHRTDFGRDCELHLTFRSGKVSFVDKGNYCSRENCGAFSSFENAQFPAISRRPIRYMNRLLKSREFNEALEQK